MTILCSVMNHVATTRRHHNQGLEFSICHRCGTDLIRIEDSAEWSKVPEGFRVVWREPAARYPGSPANPLPGAAAAARRAPRNARPAPRRDPRGRPFAGAASMVAMLANLRRLVSNDAEDKMPAMEKNGQYVIRLGSPAAC